MRTFTAYSLLALLGTAVVRPAAAFADDRLTLVTERAIVFKDGTCLVVKKAVGTSNAAGEVYTEEVPDAAVLGTFWATPVDSGRMISFVAGTKESSETKTAKGPCSGYLEILSVNTGKKTSLELDGAQTISGTISKVLAREESDPRGVRPFNFVPERSSAPVVRETSWLVGELVVIATSEGDVAVPISRIRRLAIPEMNLDIDRKTVERKTTKRMTFRFEGGAADRTLRIVYFRPGIRWIPTYRIELPRTEDGAAPGQATLRLQAEILNEAEDLIDVPIDAVAGVPNFRFKDVVSPLVLEGALRDALRQAAPQLMGQQAFASNAFRTRAGEWAEERPASTAAELPPDITTERSQDLFAYTLPKITLRRGERAAVPVFEAKVSYRDVYTWDVGITRTEGESAPANGGASPLALSGQRVWHQIELTNSSGVPWTTGAVMLEDEHRPLAQDLVTFTSAGGTVRVPITAAMDLRPSMTDEETGRKPSALRWLSWDYARVEKKSRFEVVSYLPRAVDLEIRCSIGGAADEATDGGRISLGSFRKEDWENYNGNPAVNNHSTVTFTMRIEPGKTVAPEVKYHFFVRQ